MTMAYCCHFPCLPAPFAVEFSHALLLDEVFYKIILMFAGLFVRKNDQIIFTS